MGGAHFLGFARPIARSVWAMGMRRRDCEGKFWLGGEVVVG